MIALIWGSLAVASTLMGIGTIFVAREMAKDALGLALVMAGLGVAVIGGGGGLCLSAMYFYIGL